MSYVDEMYNKGIEVKKACYYSGINRITYYYRKKHESFEDNRHAARIDSSIINKIIDLCKERVTYGYNRIWALLRNSGIRIARKTVYRIMKNNVILSDTMPLNFRIIESSMAFIASLAVHDVFSYSHTIPWRIHPPMKNLYLTIFYASIVF